MDIAELLSSEGLPALSGPHRQRLLRLALSLFSAQQLPGPSQEHSCTQATRPVDPSVGPKVLVVAANLLSSEPLLVDHMLPSSGRVLSGMASLLPSLSNDVPARCALWSILRLLLSRIDRGLREPEHSELHVQIQPEGLFRAASGESAGAAQHQGVGGRGAGMVARREAGSVGSEPRPGDEPDRVTRHEATGARVAQGDRDGDSSMADGTDGTEAEAHEDAVRVANVAQEAALVLLGQEPEWKEFLEEEGPAEGQQGASELDEGGEELEEERFRQSAVLSVVGFLERCMSLETVRLLLPADGLSNCLHFWSSLMTRRA